MKRLDKGAGKSSRRTLADRCRLQDSVNRIRHDHRSTPEFDVPSVTVDPNDFSDEDVVLQLATSDVRFSELENRRFSNRRFFFFFRIPLKWSDLSVSQIVWRCFTNKRNLAALFSIVFHLVLALILFLDNYLILRILL